MRIDECVGIPHYDRRGYGSQAELDGILGGNRRANLNRGRNFSETRLLDLHTIHAERQALRDQRTGLVGREPVLIVVRLADQFDDGLHPQTTGISDFEMQFSCIALGPQRQSEQKQPEIAQPSHRKPEFLCYQHAQEGGGYASYALGGKKGIQRPWRTAVFIRTASASTCSGSASPKARKRPWGAQ